MHSGCGGIKTIPILPSVTLTFVTTKRILLAGFSHISVANLQGCLRIPFALVRGGGGAIVNYNENVKHDVDVFYFVNMFEVAQGLCVKTLPFYILPSCAFGSL